MDPTFPTTGSKYIRSPLTSSLHLHVRVNQGEHPLELTKSFGLDDLISGLESGDTINKMILRRQSANAGCYLANICSEIEKLIQGVPGISVVHISNPFLNAEVQ